MPRNTAAAAIAEPAGMPMAAMAPDVVEAVAADAVLAADWES